MGPGHRTGTRRPPGAARAADETVLRCGWVHCRKHVRGALCRSEQEVEWKRTPSALSHAHAHTHTRPLARNPKVKHALFFKVWNFF